MRQSAKTAIHCQRLDGRAVGVEGGQVGGYDVGGRTVELGGLLGGWRGAGAGQTKVGKYNGGKERGTPRTRILWRAARLSLGSILLPK